MRTFFVTLTDGSDYKILAKNEQEALRRVLAGEGTLTGVLIIKIEEPRIGKMYNVAY